jgi:ubiquinone biosynthesis protein Coq4
MFDPFKKLKLASAFLGVADSPAAAGPESLDIAELFGRLSVKDLRAMTLQADRLLEQPGVRALYETRYLPPPEPLDKLAELGDGTLGFEYARYLRANRLPQPTIPRGFDPSDAAAYLAQRVRMTHPILHVVTEYDASPLGELALQAYYIGQLDNLISGVIVSSALLQITRDNPSQLGAALEVTAEAYQRGKAARSFLGIAWEELWSAQVPQLRELIEVPPRSSAVAQLSARVEPPARRPEPAAPAPTTSAFGEGGFAAFARTGTSNSYPAATPTAGTPAPTTNPNRGFAGFGQTPAAEPRQPAAPEPRTRPPSSSHATSNPSPLLASFMALAEQAEQQAAQPPPRPEPTRIEPPPPRTDLLREPPRTDLLREPSRLDPLPSRDGGLLREPSRVEPVPRFDPPRVEARPAAKPPPPPPPKAAPPPPPTPPAPPPAQTYEPGYSVEESTKGITPALSPDDPDYF